MEIEMNGGRCVQASIWRDKKIQKVEDENGLTRGVYRMPHPDPAPFLLWIDCVKCGTTRRFSVKENLKALSTQEGTSPMVGMVIAVECEDCGTIIGIRLMRMDTMK